MKFFLGRNRYNVELIQIFSSTNVLEYICTTKILLQLYLKKADLKFPPFERPLPFFIRVSLQPVQVKFVQCKTTRPKEKDLLSHLERHVKHIII